MKISDASILVVDDEDFSLSVVSNMLKDLGVKRVFQARDGNQALETLNNEAKGASCVISDFNMPRMNGLTLLRNIRDGATALDKNLGFAMLTGVSDANLVRSAIQLSVDAFLMKPVSKDQLGERLETILAGHHEETIPHTVALGDASDVQKVLVKDIKENMIIAEDLMMKENLVLEAGVRLSPRLIQQLRDLDALFGPLDPIVVKV